MDGVEDSLASENFKLSGDSLGDNEYCHTERNKVMSYANLIGRFDILSYRGGAGSANKSPSKYLDTN
jgi:hypothetical protein